MSSSFFPHAQSILSQPILNSFRLFDYIKLILNFHLKIFGLRSLNVYFNFHGLLQSFNIYILEIDCILKI